jgi:NAD-dependent dihydropyrimidine dehydrogenase PreA subunit
MTYVIGAACVDVMDRSCMEECPVDCIYEGARKLYIHPTECIDCGACAEVCPEEAISADRAAALEHRLDNRRFFEEPLPGRPDPVGSPGGFAKIGAIGVDTSMITAG